MNNPPFQQSRGRDHARPERGAALVLVLACVAILSTLVLAFLLYSQLQVQVSAASAAQTRADLFARGAVDAVIGELKQEITAGSTNLPSESDVRSPYTLFTPVTNWTAVPYQMTNASGVPVAPNVLKWSAYNTPFYVGTWYDTVDWPAPNYAANDSSTNPSYNGRFVSTTNWNLPVLMPVADSNSTNLTPTNSFLPPDWVYLNRSATPVTSWNSNLIPDTISGSFNTNRVVGRYAYVVYDEGGLLDANVAGYPPAIGATTFRHKISEACADLTQIGLTNSDITTLINWRNPNNGASATTYSNYVYSSNYLYPSIGSLSNAFLTPASGEQLFTSRQQLINFLTQNVAASPTDVERMESALPYLTTFSRELNQPSWYPEYNAASWGGPASYAYNSTMTNVSSTSTNENILVPLAKPSNTFTDTNNGLVVTTNEPTTFTRFPLSRLSWLATNNAPTTPIQTSFGLSWDASYAAWKYVGSKTIPSTTTLGSIETLEQVAAENPGREPNFFELLKAGMLSGSLGMYVDPTVSNNGFWMDARYTGGNGGGSPVDLHVMQIGLGIINQSNASPLPARIEFGNNTGTSALYGAKNLPYISQMTWAPMRPTSLPLGNTSNTIFNAWAEPIFWSPYQTATNSTSQLSMRVVLTQGSLRSSVAYTTGIVTTTDPAIFTNPGIAYGNGTTVPFGTLISISESVGGTLVKSTTNPVFLSWLDQTNNISVSGTGTTGTNYTVYKETVNGVKRTYAGFWLGLVSAIDPVPNANIPAVDVPPLHYGTPYYYWSNGGLTYSNSAGLPPQFQLQANYGIGAGWQEIQRINLTTAAYQGATDATSTNSFTTYGSHDCYVGSLDPRTGRFGTLEFDRVGNQPGNAFYPCLWNTNNYYEMASYPDRITTTNGGLTFYYGGQQTATNSTSAYRFADNSAISGSTNTPYYTDPDGAQRRGDGWWNNSTPQLTTNIYSPDTLPWQGYVANSTTMTTNGYKPVLLQRNYYSVGELGYAYRDIPWRSIDFCNTNSADGGLLDLFCVNDGYAGSTNTPLVGGRVDLNTQNPTVLAALLSGAARSEFNTSNDINTQDATNIAAHIVDYTATNGPLLNKAEIATRLAQLDPTVYPNATSEPQIDTNIKEYREALVRALAEAGQVRTWNLMIDVIAQIGYFPPSANSLSSSQFVVNAQRRYWAHVALDRYTGQVIDMQIEPVGQ